MTIDDYILAHTTPQDPALYELVRKTNLNVVQPRMLSGHLQGELLTILTSILQPYNVLELGTFTGYSAITIAHGLPSGAMLHTIEQHDELEMIATEFFEKAAVQDKITQHFGDALTIIKQFDKPFDMVFIDADKRQYPDYYNALFNHNLLHVGSLIIADNTLWDGHVITEPMPQDTHTQGIIRFNDMVMADERVRKVILPLRDGLSLIRVVKL